MDTRNRNHRNFLAAKTKKSNMQEMYPFVQVATSALTWPGFPPLQGSDFPAHIVIFWGFLIICTCLIPGTVTSMLQSVSNFP